MIVTVTPNPSIDRTLRIGRLERGAVIRVSSVTDEAGGKGLNVARALAQAGIEALAVLPMPDRTEATYVALVGTDATLASVPVCGAMRINLSLVEDDGTVTKVNEAGPTLDGAAVEELLDRVVGSAIEPDWVVGCGSLPPGMATDFYGRVAAAVPGSVRVAVDASGPALAAAAEAGVALLKPNRVELEELTGRSLPTLGAVVDAAAALLDAGVGAVLTSLGPDGALYLWPGGAVHADARIDDVANTVGAGDALLAGFLAGGGDADAVVTAVAWGVAACRSPGTRMRPVRAEDMAAVVRRAQIDRARRLS